MLSLSKSQLMGYYKDPNDGLLYECVKWHTKQKHAFIEKYLQIWTEYVKEHPPTLDIFDLYASTGLCYCEDTKTSWKGSALLAADCLSSYPRGRNLFLNTFHSDSKLREQQKENLQQILKDYKKPFEIQTLPINDALARAMELVNPRYPNLWLLDPYAASDLPWDVVKLIGQLEARYHYHGRMQVRKPEMIINLITMDLQRNINHNPHIISIALGLSEKDWRPKFDTLIREGKNTREAIIELYGQGLSRLYEKPPIIAEIEITEGSAIVYCLFLCTDSNAGHYIMRLKKIPELENWRISEWKPNAEKIVFDKNHPGQSTFNQFS